MPVYKFAFESKGISIAFNIELDEGIPIEKLIIHDLQKNRLYEPDITRLMLRILKPGEVFVDVGANIGFFTLLAANLLGPTGKVIAFEPGPQNIKRLKNNIALNNFTNVTLIEQPVSNRAEEVDFYINQDDSGGNALWNPALLPVNIQSQKNLGLLKLKATTLDEKLGVIPKLLKIDTEGAEQKVLEGTERLLSNHKIPFVITELHGFGLEQMGASQLSLRSFMESKGYSCFALYHGERMPKLIPPRTRINNKYIINLLFSSIDRISDYWPEEYIDSAIWG